MLPFLRWAMIALFFASSLTYGNEMEDLYAVKRKTTRKRKLQPQEVRSPRSTYDPRPAKVGAAFGLGYHFIGPAAAVEGWYNIDRSLQVGGRLTYAKNKLESADELTGGYVESADAALTTITGHVRYFLVGKFYINAGLNLDSGSGNFGYESGGIKQSSSYSMSATHFHAGIGNQWVSPTGAVWGVDWFGFGKMLSQSITVDATKEFKDVTLFLTNDEPNVRLKTIVDDNFRYYFLMFYFGTTF